MSKEAVVVQSPHVFDPGRILTEEERKERYATRIDSKTSAYTVIETLKKVYRVSFAEDLLKDVEGHPEKYKISLSEWNVVHAWVNSLTIIRPESAFFQPEEDFRIDILVDTRIKLEEVRAGNESFKNRYNVTPQLRLRYSLDLRPCHMNCRFVGVIQNEKDSLLNNDPYKIPADKYLLPVLIGDDYKRMAAYILSWHLRRHHNTDAPVDIYDWIKKADIRIKYGAFPEGEALGEYFFDFGTASVISPATGVIRTEEIDPGTIILNYNIFNDETMKKSTLTHEMIHYYLGHHFFLLQKMHGRKLCSYMCKRFHGEHCDKWSAIDIMELQANKMPGYLLIQDDPGRAYAERVLSYYSGIRSLEVMRNMVEEMACHFVTTKTVARTRLIDFGFNEARGLLQSANGKLVPSYISTLGEDEAYTIDEADGIREYLRNPQFRKIINTGLYVYVEGHYCLNDQKYIKADQLGRKYLTRYAREHMDECCLVFQKIYRKSEFQMSESLIRKGVGKGRQEIRYKNKDGSSPVTEEGKARLNMIRKQTADRMAIEKTFNQMLVDLMDRRKMTIVPLAEATGLSRETIKNMRNDPGRVFPIQEIVAVAIALHLPAEISKEFIRKAPSSFLETEEIRYAKIDKQDAIYKWNAKMIPVGLIHPASAGHGLNLQAGGSCIIWFGLTWSLELYQQTNARLWRQGQVSKTVVIQHIITKGTIDERILQALKGKNATQEALIAAVKADLGGGAVV